MTLGNSGGQHRSSTRYRHFIAPIIRPNKLLVSKYHIRPFREAHRIGRTSSYKLLRQVFPAVPNLVSIGLFINHSWHVTDFLMGLWHGAVVNVNIGPQFASNTGQIVLNHYTPYRHFLFEQHFVIPLTDFQDFLSGFSFLQMKLKFSKLLHLNQNQGHKTGVRINKENVKREQQSVI